jgi:cell division protein ZapE
VTPLGARADAALDAAWSQLTGGAAGAPEKLTVLGRTIVIPRTAHGAARMTFDEICGRALAAADYLVIARRYDLVMIDRIPQLGPGRRDEARRFTVLIDTLYDEGVKLICSAAAAPTLLYCGDDDDAFSRTASRLMEMQSRDYLLRTARMPVSADELARAG